MEPRCDVRPHRYNEMVPVNTVDELLLSDARKALVRELAVLAGRNDLDEALAAWLLPTQDIGLTVQGPARTAAARVGAERTYRDVAVLGFAAAAGSIEPAQRKILNEGLKWVAGREPFMEGLPTGLCTDAVALLGIALGAKSAGEDAARRAIADWTSKFLAKCYEMRGVQDWQRCLFAAAQREAGAVPELSLPHDSSVADIRTALYAKGILVRTDDIWAKQDEMNTLLLLKREAGARISLVRSAFRVAAFDWINRSTPSITLSRPTVNDISELLRHLPAGLRLWTWEKEARTSGRNAEARRWHIDNEYHVQNLLWFLLAPLFPGLKNEEYTPSVGQLHPRVDLCIPSLKLVIEVKFVRANKAFREVIEEVAADASLYLTDSSIYTGIIAFVWDDSRRSEEHATLVRGLKQIKGVNDAIVISRPGSMVEA